MITKQVARVVSFDRGGVSVFIEVDGETAAECLAEVDVARAVLLRHVEAEKPAAMLPTFDEWVASAERGTQDRDRHLHQASDAKVESYSFGIIVPDDVYALLLTDYFGGTPDRSVLMIYNTTARRNESLRQALLRLGKIRGDA